jgi:hypothetical protein
MVHSRLIITFKCCAAVLHGIPYREKSILLLEKTVLYAPGHGYTQANDEHTPDAEDDSLLVCLKKLHQKQLGIADFNLHENKKPYRKRDYRKTHNTKQHEVKYFYGIRSFRADCFPG